MKRIFVILLFICCSALQAYSANTPCSGRKGGISHCIGSTFVCNDGSTSASKKDCTAYMGGGSSGSQFIGSGSTSDMSPTTGDCSCRSGSYCVGPRGGHYCYTDSGRKNYLKR